MPSLFLALPALGARYVKAFCLNRRRRFWLSQSRAIAQKPTPTPVVKIDDPNDVIKVNSRLVVVPTSVTDASGNTVLGLTANDFKINEEGRTQTIESVSPGEKVPLEIALSSTYRRARTRCSSSSWTPLRSF